MYKPHAFHVDEWQTLDVEAELPASGAYFLGLERALELLESGKPAFRLGVIVDAGEDVTRIGDHLDKIEAVAVNFPAFADGRAGAGNV